MTFLMKKYDLGRNLQNMTFYDPGPEIIFFTLPDTMTGGTTKCAGNFEKILEIMSGMISGHAGHFFSYTDLIFCIFCTWPLRFLQIIILRLSPSLLKV